MKYYVCFQNCLFDFYYENAPSLKFDSFDAAIRYLTSLTESSPIPTPDPTGELKWYFPNYATDGVFRESNSEADWLDLDQIINIIPERSSSNEIMNCYCNDEDALISMQLTYRLDYLGQVHNVHLKEIEYIDQWLSDPDEI